MTNNFDGQRFHNYNKKGIRPGLHKLIYWRLTRKVKPWPKFVKNNFQDKPPIKVNGDKVRISFVGHATFLIQVDGVNILTDPVWSARASPIGWLGPKRVALPGIEFNDLPPIDVVLVSHNHYDHLDIPTLKRLFYHSDPIIIVPSGEQSIKTSLSQAKVVTLNWHHSINCKRINIVFEPAQHWSARSLWDYNKSLWGTFIINTAVANLCFVGDSGYDQEMFQQIAGRHPNILVSMLPIGAYMPRYFMKEVHMNPEESVKAHFDLNTCYSIASHFNTFSLADDGYNQSVQDLTIACKKYNLSFGRFLTLQIGQAQEFSRK